MEKMGWVGVWRAFADFFSICSSIFVLPPPWLQCNSLRMGCGRTIVCSGKWRNYMYPDIFQSYNHKIIWLSMPWSFHIGRFVSRRSWIFIKNISIFNFDFDLNDSLLFWKHFDLYIWRIYTWHRWKLASYRNPSKSNACIIDTVIEKRTHTLERWPLVVMARNSLSGPDRKVCLGAHISAVELDYGNGEARSRE